MQYCTLQQNETINNPIIRENETIQYIIQERCYKAIFTKQFNEYLQANQDSL